MHYLVKVMIRFMLDIQYINTCCCLCSNVFRNSVEVPVIYFYLLILFFIIITIH